MLININTLEAGSVKQMKELKDDVGSMGITPEKQELTKKIIGKQHHINVIPTYSTDVKLS
jgi:hypothetical protein